MLFSDPAFLDHLGATLIVLGLVGQVSLFFFPEDRRLLERSVGVLFTLVVIGGAAATWRAGTLRYADRDLTPAQQAALGKAIGQFPTVKLEVMTSRDDREAHALALKIVDAIRSGSGAAPLFSETLTTPLTGVVLILDGRNAEPDLTAADAVGRLLMAARIATIGNVAPELGEHTMRIVVGRKPP